MKPGESGAKTIRTVKRAISPTPQPAAPLREATPIQKLSRGTGPAGEPGAEVTRARRPGSLPAQRQPQALSPSIIQSLRHIKMDLKRHFTFSLLNIHIITTHRLLF